MVSKISIKFGDQVVEVTGKNIRIAGGIIYADGQSVTVTGAQKPVNVIIYGDVGTLESDGDVTVNGNAGQVTATNGNIHTYDVAGDVSSKNGNITCGTVSGNVTAKNGNIRHR